MTVRERFEHYKELYEAFTKIDDFNLTQVAKRVPQEKHFWAARLIEAKIARDEVKKQKTQLRNSLITKMMDDSPVNLDKKLLDKIDNTPQFEEINEKIQEWEYLVEYLELIMKSVSFIAQDIKNIISLKEMEQL